MSNNATVVALFIVVGVLALVEMSSPAWSHEEAPDAECPPCPCASPEEVAIALEAIRASAQVAAEAEAIDAELVADSEAANE